MVKLSLYLVPVLLIMGACKTNKGTGNTTNANTAASTVNIEVNTEPVVDGINRFAFELYNNVDGNENQIFSPFSISSALAMTYAGAKDNTAKEFVKVFHFPEDQQSFHPSFKELMAQIESAQNDHLEIAIANALWPEKDFSFLQDYLDLMKEYYGVDITYLSYKTDPEAARLIINKWVEDKTNDKIKDLLKPGILTKLTRLVLTNAIYFKGDWEHAFNEDATYTAPFYPNSNEEISCPRMNMTMDNARFMENDLLSMLELPYSENKMSMVLILPKEKDGLEEVEKNLSYEKYKAYYEMCYAQKVIIGIPKFKIDFYLELTDVLKAMGLEGAFSDNADFSGMTGKKDLKIDKVIHKAFIEVNESGTEAAAATAVIMIEKSSAVSPPPPKQFIADHPFIYLIKDNQSGAVLFMGKVVNPLQ